MENQRAISNLLRQSAKRHDPDRLDDALTALAPHNEGVHLALTSALSDEDAGVRLLAVEIVRELGRDAEPVLPALIEKLEDPDRIVRTAALEPVAAFGAKSMDAIPILEKWLTSDDQFAKVSAAGHIVMIDSSRSDEMRPYIDEALASENSMIQRQAQWLMEELGWSAASGEAG